MRSFYTEWLYWSTAPTSFSKAEHYVHVNGHCSTGILRNSQIWSGKEVELASTRVWRWISWAELKKRQLSIDAFKTKESFSWRLYFNYSTTLMWCFDKIKSRFCVCAHMPVCIVHLYYNGWHCVPHCPVIFFLFSTVIVAKETRCYGNIMTACTQPARKNDDVTLLPQE